MFKEIQKLSEEDRKFAMIMYRKGKCFDSTSNVISVEIEFKKAIV